MELLELISWKTNGIPEENVENTIKSDINFAPTSADHYLLPHINFNRLKK